jgi:cytochrome o ubiquinol oxidase subunit 2
VSAAERLILLNATAIMLVVVVPVIVLTLGFAWWYRSGNRRAAYDPEWAYSGRIELVVWSIPAMVVILLGRGRVDRLPPTRSRASNSQLEGEKPVRIQVVSLDWKWLFIYPDENAATVNELVVPVGRTARVRADIRDRHECLFRAAAGQSDIHHARHDHAFEPAADEVGDYPGISSHYSGDGFSDMRFVVHAVSPADYRNGWNARTASRALDDASYAELARTSSNVALERYGKVDSMMLEHILQTRPARKRRLTCKRRITNGQTDLVRHPLRPAHSDGSVAVHRAGGLGVLGSPPPRAGGRISGGNG